MISLLVLGAVTLPQRWTLAIGGDAMFNGIDATSKPIASIESELRKADAAIINLEIPLTSSSTATPRKTAADRAAKRQFILKGSPKHIKSLDRAGIDVVSLANNHAMDYGVLGAAEQRQILDRARIKHAGTGANQSQAEAPAHFKSPKGVDFALISFLSFMSHSSNDICWPATKDKPGLAALKFGGKVDDSKRRRLVELVKRAERTSGFVVVALHWGIEKQSVPTPYQVALARAFVDAGADLVLGHHPHVLQGAEVYRGKAIFYSLGNFVSTMRATSAIFTLNFQRSEFMQARMTPIRMAGKVWKLQNAEARAELKRFEGLCDAISRRYPSKLSTPPTVVL